MAPRAQGEICRALVTARRYLQQNEKAAFTAAIEGWPAPLAEAIRGLLEPKAGAK